MFESYRDPLTESRPGRPSGDVTQRYPVVPVCPSQADPARPRRALT